MAMSSPIRSRPSRRAAPSAASSRRSAASGTAASASASPPAGQRMSGSVPKRASACAAPAVPATAMRAVKPRRRQKAEDAFAHPRLAAEQMGDAGQIEPEAVRAGAGGARRPAAGGEQAQPREPGGVALGVGGADVEAGNEDPRLGERHAGPQAERARRRAGGGEDVPIAVRDGR